MGSLKKIDNADLLVVFGTKINEDGTPSSGLKARLDETVFVYRKHVASLIFVSGGLGKEGYNEAKVMADYLLTQNIPREAVILDEKGVNTRATVRNVVELCTKQHFKSVIAISSKPFSEEKNYNRACIVLPSMITHPRELTLQ